MQKKILILSNHFITLYNFRKELITKLINDGHEVYISLPKSNNNVFFENLGCKIIDTPVDRRGINPFKDIKLILNYIRIMKKTCPDIIFSYTIKPNIYGGLASKLVKCKQISNITGTGATFINEDIVSKVVKLLYKISLKKSYKVFFQNKGDKDYFIKNNMVENNYQLIPGSGVNLKEYELYDLPLDGTVNFIFIGRIMEVKGVDEYLQMAKRIKKKYPYTNFYVAGFIEEKKYESIIKSYSNERIIEYVGFQKNIKEWIKKCHCTILPSHGGEGVPNVLLESAAMGRVCIASNINGSRDVIDNRKTGFLFEPGNSEQLISRVEDFLKLDYATKKEMCIKARKKVEIEFDREIIVNAYFKELKESL